MGLFRNSSLPRGYGAKDGEMADDLAKAESMKEADAIAKANGLKDTRDAYLWLAERDSNGWVG